MSDHTSRAPDLSVIVATRNRARDVAACLDSLVADTSECITEVIVVDNGSTDDTAGTVAARLDATPGLRYVAEPVLGLTPARNTGLRAAGAEHIAFLDDDATVRDGWADAMLDGLRGSDVAGVAGRILLSWPDGVAPRWYSAAMDGWFTHFDRGDEAHDLPEDLTPWGANMGMQRSHALESGGFGAALGRKGRSLLSGEEVDLYRRVRERTGGRLVYRPDCVVDHHVQPERLSLRWVFRRSFAGGQSTVVMRRLWGIGPRSRSRTIVAGLRSLARSVLRDVPGTVVRIARADNRPASVAGEVGERVRAAGMGYQLLRDALERAAQPTD